MSKSLHDLLVAQLVELMRGMTAKKASSVAHDLTILMSTFLANPSSSLQGVDRAHVLPREVWTEMSVGIPWEAYSYAHGTNVGLGTTQYVDAVCTGPHGLDLAAPAHGSIARPWGGSLLVSIGTIFRETNNSLLVTSPYWRRDGCKALLAAASRESYAGVAVEVFTQPARLMKSKDLEGLKYFAQTLQEMGAQVSLASPRPIQGNTPMLHSKLVVADRLVAYVGSANFTKSGLDHGFEAGVAARGPLAAAFAGWTNSLRTICDVENNFEKWATRSSAE